MNQDRWGFWIPVVDEASARRAIGYVPLHLMAVWMFLGFPTVRLLEGHPTLHAVVFATGGLGYGLLNGEIVRGNLQLVPVACCFSLAGCFASLFLLPLYAAPLPILIGLLAISGFRGWLFLRRHSAP